MTAPTCRILIVEDEPLIAMMLEDFVDMLGKSVAGTADSVATAMQAIEGGGVRRRDPRPQPARRREEHGGCGGAERARHPLRVRHRRQRRERRRELPRSALPPQAVHDGERREGARRALTRTATLAPSRARQHSAARHEQPFRQVHACPGRHVYGRTRAGAPSQLLLRDGAGARRTIGQAPSWRSPAPATTARRATRTLDVAGRRGAGGGDRQGGGMPRRFNTITVTDGIAMGHQGMKSSLVSREVIADSVELSVRGHCYDALVGFAGCDKSLPGMMMAMLRLNVPSIFVYGGSIHAGSVPRDEDVTVVDCVRGGRQVRGRRLPDRASCTRWRRWRAPATAHAAASSPPTPWPVSARRSACQLAQQQHGARALFEQPRADRDRRRRTR